MFFLKLCYLQVIMMWSCMSLLSCCRCIVHHWLTGVWLLRCLCSCKSWASSDYNIKQAILHLHCAPTIVRMDSAWLTKPNYANLFCPTTYALQYLSSFAQLNTIIRLQYQFFLSGKTGSLRTLLGLLFYTICNVIDRYLRQKHNKLQLSTSNRSLMHWWQLSYAETKKVTAKCYYNGPTFCCCCLLKLQAAQ